MKLSKRDYRYYKSIAGDDMHFITAKRHNGRRAILFGNYSIHSFILFLDVNILTFDSWDSWEIKEIMDDYLKKDHYFYIGIW